ncbi:MAG: recombinase family protein, partial [Clostridia bacterium]|nr:recombinase family protein [Clostridia bacterium]
MGMTVAPVNVLSDNALRVAAYARVSTDKDDQANSFESQVKYFTEFIDRQENWQLVKVYSDDGISGTSTKKRVGFNSMIDDVMNGKIDFIVTKEVSRFARNTVDTLQITRELGNIGVGVYFMLDNINTLDKDGELRLTLMASLAQEESRKTSERVKWGQKRQMEKGVVFGRDLLGYKVEKGKLYLVEDEAEIVKKIFHKYLIEGKGTHIIARELKEEGIKPYDPDGRAKYKNDWSNTQILRVLRNEKYVGDLAQKKTWTKNYLDHKKRYNRGAEDIIYIKDHHPDIAIISREMWNATQAELQRRTTTAEQKSKHSNRYWASGKIFCGVCGERFVNKIKNTSAGQSRAWNCMNHVKPHAFRQAECSMYEWARDRSMKNVVLYILNMLVENKDELKAEIVKEISQLNLEEKVKSTDEIQSKIDRLEQKKLKLLDIRLAEEISK